MEVYNFDLKKKCITKLGKGGNLDKDKFLIGLEE